MSAECKLITLRVDIIIIIIIIIITNYYEVPQ